jgi:hypothetical protein
MTLPEAAEKVFEFTESITESGNHTFILDIDERRSIYFEANVEVDWVLVQTEPDEYDRVQCDLNDCSLVVQDDSGDVVEDITKELQQEFCKWFGKVEFEINN